MVGDPARTVVAVDRLLIVTSSPRLPAGLLSWPAWEALRSGQVYTLDPTDSQAQAVRAAGVDVQEAPADAAAFRQLARAGHTVVWLAGPDGDAASSRRWPSWSLPTPTPSWKPWPARGTRPARRLLDVVAVMDRLRSPGGCPWDAEQTHQSLAPYLLEESYELLEAIELDDLAHLREELGDVLLQVAFHARLAEERPGRSASRSTTWPPTW